ncbi:hypothetical protein AWW72_14170 [Acinetobacter sp. NRRL B-65365]|uniref:hypothetical protein n=1 Tax=Acinetobacter sp. NRRL B-65365 TaxID=1785092 RepID=UPI0007A095CC|nr:hypothetical protein [Acinetobacter sp. NRRL B-65365]KYQ83485.1 hypothetical protein AWW72_14170 [Acinetobacter sp. NRRL B-65365]
MTNISNEVSTHNSDFIVGDTVVINTPLEFINRTFDSDELFIVQNICGLLSNGVNILINGERVIAADSELRHASVAELNAKRRLSNAKQVFAEVS